MNGTKLPANQVQTNYARFVTELTELTRKYGVALRSIGGVTIAYTKDEFANVTYTDDMSSGDIEPIFAEI